MFSICSISALLSFQLLPQPRLLGCRGGARPRRFGGRQPRVHPDFRAAGSSALRAPSPPVELVPKETGNDQYAECRDGSPGCVRVYRCPPSVERAALPLESAIAVHLSPAEKGSEEAWRTLENELKAPVAPFHPNSPFIRLANIGQVTLPRFPHVKKSGITTLSGVEGINEIFMKGKPLTASGT